MEHTVPPLSDSLGLPDTSAENQLTPEALSNGYRVSYEALGISDKGELELSLCNEAEQWAPASVASYRKVVLQQLRAAYRTHKAKREAGVLYDVPLDGASLNTAIAYPQQHTVGEAARQQWVQDLAGSAPLGGLAASVPHGFMRGKLFDMLAEEQVPLPRAIWFIQVVYLNRSKPEGWDGGARLPARSSQCSEDLLSYLDQSASALSTTAGAAGPSDPPAAACAAAGPAQARWQYMLRLVGGLLCRGLLHVPSLLSWLLGRAASLPAGLQLQLLPVLHLMLRDVAQSPPLLRQVVDASLKLGAPSPPAPTSPEPPAPAPSKQPAAPASAAAPIAVGTAGLLPSQPGQTVQQEWQQPEQQEQQQQSQQQADQDELRRGYADVIVALLPLAPLAFVPLDAVTLSALQSLVEGCSRHGSNIELHGGGEAAAVATAAALLREVGRVQQRLASFVSPRVLRLPDARAMQLLDEHRRSCDGPAAHAELWKLLLPPAPSLRAQQQAQHDLVRLVCSWAVSHPAAGVADVLGEHLQQQQGEEGQGQQQQQLKVSEHGAEGDWAWDADLVPGRALLALATLKHHIQQQGQEAQQQGQQQQQPLAGVEQLSANQGLQGAFFGWLDWEAQQLRAPLKGQPAEAGPQHLSRVAGRAAAWVSSRRPHRIWQWATMLAENGLLSPSHYLQSLLASGVLHRAAQQARQGRLAPRAQFHILLLQELHPALVQQQNDPQQQQLVLVGSPPAASTPPPAAGQKRKLSGEPAGPRQTSASPAADPSAAPAAAAGLGDPAQPNQKFGASQAQGAAQPQHGQQAQQRAAVEAYAALRRATLQQYACGAGKGQQGGAAAQRSSRSRSATPPVPNRTTQLRAASMATADALQATSLGGDTESEWGSRLDREPSVSLATTTWANSGWRQRRYGPGGSVSVPGALRQLEERLEHLLGLRQAAASPVAVGEPLAAVEAGGGDGLQRQLWRDALEDIRGLSAWQQRHLSTWLYNSSRQHMRACLPPSSPPAAAAAPATARAGNSSNVTTASGSSTASVTAPSHAVPTLYSAWLLNVLGALDACGSYREVGDLLCDLLAALLRMLAAAALSTAASSPGQSTAPPAAQARPASISSAVWAAQDAFWRHTGLSPSLIFSLVSAQHERLATLGRVPRLLRMLTAGLWTLVPPASHRQHAQQSQQGPTDPRLAQRAQQDPRQAQQDAQQAQQELLSCCHGQLALAGELLSFYGGSYGMAATSGASNRPGSAGQVGRGSQASGTTAATGGANAGVQQWVGEVEKQHGAQHWLLTALRRLAAEAAAARVSPAGPRQASDRAGPGAAGNSSRGQAGIAGRTGGVSAAASPPLAALDAVGLMQRVADAPGLLQEALAQLQGWQLSSSGGDAARTFALESCGGGSNVLASAWEAADQVARWASQRAPVSNSNPAAIQEFAAAAILVVFESCKAAAARSGTDGMAGGLAAGLNGAQEFGEGSGLGAGDHGSSHLECLARLVELLRRHNRQSLPATFLPAAVVAAAQHSQGGYDPDNLTPGHSCPPLLLMAVGHGVVPLERCLGKVPGLQALLLANPWALSGIGIGEAWALSCFQRCLPPTTAADALLTVTDSRSVAAEGCSGPTSQLQQEPSKAALASTVSPYVREACLSSPRQLYTALTRRALAAAAGGAAATPQALASSPAADRLKEVAVAYPPLEAALMCIAGTAWRQAGPAAGAESGLLSAVLAGAEPAALPLCWLVVRGLLDEQAFQAALRRGESRQSAIASTATYQAGGGAAAAALAGRDGHGSLSEAEKDFTSRILAELAERPQSAGVLCALCSEAGRGLADYLLQQLDWVLQDGDSVMGRHSLAAVLARRGALISTPAFKPASAPSAPRPEHNPRHGTAQPQSQPQLSPTDEPSGSRGSSSEGRAYAVEQGFVEAALGCLAASSDARRRGFAQQLVQQLHRLAEVVARLAPPSAAFSTAGASQDGSSQEQGEGGVRQAGRTGRQLSEEERPGEARSPGTYATASSPAAAAGLAAGSRPGSGRAGWGRAATAAAGWGAGGRGALRGGKPSTDYVGSVVGVQVAVWLRLGILFPLLPLVYSDPSQDPVTGLRGQLLSVATRLLGSPYITATPDSWPASDPQAPAAATAAELAGEPLPARLLHILYALAGNSWASWLQGGRQLRDVPPYEGGRQLTLTIEGLPAPKRLKLAAAAALPAAATALAVLPSAALQDPAATIGAAAGEPAEPQAVPAIKAAARADPWLFMPGGATGAEAQYRQADNGSQQVPYWLQGAVRVKRRDLTYSLMGA
ncbi:hypothetical protein N2152v2_009230 [Parachlorella kessleri]